MDSDTAKLNDGYGEETVVPLKGGVGLHAPAHPVACDYVRFVDAAGKEIAYWNSDEWRENPQEVMGAIVGALKQYS